MKRSTFLKRKAKILRRDNRFKPNSFRVYFFKSNKHYYASLIDNNTGNVLFSLGTQKISSLDKNSLERISDLASAFASLMSNTQYDNLSFDRGVYKFHGLVKHFVEQVRNQGIRI